MIKFFYFLSVSCVFLLDFTPAFAFEKHGPINKVPTNEIQCNTPPPDSFRITSASTNFISLEWKQAFVEDTYTMTILKKNSFGDWTPVFSNLNINGNSYVFNTQDPGGTEYRFRLATNCSPGDPSQLVSNVDGINLIIELVLGGRTPINPIVVGCTKIPLNTYAWVGFKVTHFIKGGSISNLFEVAEEDGALMSSPATIRIKRVSPFPQNPIVATNDDGIYPQVPNMPVPASSPFYMRDKSNPEDEVIGRIRVAKNYNLASIDLCIYNFDPPWDFDHYNFEPLVAIKVEALGPIVEARSTNQKSNIFKIQNPFSENLNLFTTNSNLRSMEAKLSIMNIKGEIVLAEKLEISESLISIPVGSICSGIYILRIETKNEVQAFKIIKLN